ncbi:hypothetical protein Taro_044455 [Colocasia esculenta]|uniref:Uncharacterized protein n=1 Tax=Colocasia esculenta TaxID=4460 RepID=A0A843WU39_COLES|nr:hypothetical protein [Colocasia esculenta]
MCSESMSASPVAEQNPNGHNDGVSTDFGLSIGSSLSGKHLLKSKEVVISQRNGDDQEPSLQGLDEQASSSTMPVSVSRGEILSPITGEHSTSNHDYQNNAGRAMTSNVPQRNLPANSSLVGNQVDIIPDAHRSSENSGSASSVQSATEHSLEEESDEGAGALDPGLFIPLRARQRRSGSILHVDIVSISSNVFSRNSGGLGNHEARRNSRRLFWDAFSRRSSERDDGSHSMLFSSEDEDDLASHDRWLFNFSDFLGNGEASDYHSRHSSSERRWRSRSEMRERFRDGLDERSGRPSLCASGLHPDGTCSCETFLLAEGSGARASISRIVMLAEALFEVLDEIHRQPVPLSLSMVSQPAPESVVDSFPLKIHSKSSAAESGDVEQ